MCPPAASAPSGAGMVFVLLDSVGGEGDRPLSIREEKSVVLEEQ